MSPGPVALRVIPALVALAEVALLVAALHVPIGHAMRTRGLLRWRLRDTALVSPLALVGGFVCLVSANHGMARLAYDVASGEGYAHAGHALLSAAVAAGGAVVAGFGVRAVGKLY